MPQLISAVFCQRTLIDSQRNTISFMDLIETTEIHGKDIPETLTLPANAEIATSWIRKNKDIPEKGSCRIYLCDPKGEHNKNAQLQIDLSKSLVCRAILRIISIDIRGEGLYEFHIEVNSEGKEDQWELVRTIPFLITFLNDEPLNPKTTTE
jgi:hypothetical protein